MSLTEAQKQELQEALKRTSGFRDKMMKEKVVPEDYRAWLGKVKRETLMLPVPAVNVPVKIRISEALDRTDQCPVHVNMHGGGFVFPQSEDDDLFCAHVAAGIRGIVVDIDYASAFDHPFPTAFEQCYEVVRWVFSKCADWHADPAKVSAGGQSAGGELTAAIALRSAASGDFRLCLQILEYAAIENYQAVLEGGNERSRAFSLYYCDGDVRVLQSPYVSPVYATDAMLAGQPPILIINGGLCPFKKVNEEYGLRLAALGTEVTIKSFMKSHHGFTVRLTDEWRESQELIIRSISKAGPED